MYFANTEQHPAIGSRHVGMLPDGRAVEAWTLHGAGGLVLETITYGAAVTRLLVPDRQGHMADVVLGFDSLEAYVDGKSFMGAMAGRVAGRMANAEVSLDGRVFALPANDGPNHLHGGPGGFHTKLWTASAGDCSGDDVALKLTYLSPDGEEGYPGDLRVDVTYTVTADNSFDIRTETISDRTTPCSLTHHSYFNLAGEGSGSVCEHRLAINADEVATVNEQMTLTGKLHPVSLPGNDLRREQDLRTLIPQIFCRHGDLYRLRALRSGGTERDARHAARLYEPVSGRVLDVFTTEDYLQLYTGCGLDGTLTGKSGATYFPYQGLCLECEGYPDGVSVPGLGDILLRPGIPRTQQTTYRFSSDCTHPPGQEPS